MPPTVEERLAVIETTNAWQSEAIREILDEVKKTGAFVSTYTVKVDELCGADLNNRLTRMESQQKVYVRIGGGIIGVTGVLALLKEKIMAILF